MVTGLIAGEHPIVRQGIGPILDETADLRAAEERIDASTTPAVRRRAID